MVSGGMDANPEGVEFLSLSMFNPCRVGVVNWSQPRVPLGTSPVAIQIDPLRGCCKAALLASGCRLGFIESQRSGRYLEPEQATLATPLCRATALGLKERIIEDASC